MHPFKIEEEWDNLKKEYKEEQKTGENANTIR